MSTLSPQNPSQNLPKASPGLFGRLRDGLFGLIVVGGLIAVLAFFARRFAFDHVDEKIRTHVLNQLISCFPGKNVELQSARLIENEGISLRGITVELLDGEEGALHIDEIFAASKVTLQQLMTTQVTVDHVQVRGVEIYIEVEGDWREAVRDLMPKAMGGMKPPPAEISDIQVELREKATGKSLEFRLPSLIMTDNQLAPSHVVDATGPTRRRLTGNKSRREPEEVKAPQEEAFSHPASEIEEGLAIRGVAAAKWCQAIDFTGRIDPQEMRWEIEGAIEDLQANSALLESLPFVQLDPRLAASRVQGKLACDFYAASQGPDKPIAFGVRGKFFDGKIDDPRLAQPLVSLQGKFEATSAGAKVWSVSAEMGEAKLDATATLEGYEPTSPLHVELFACGLRIDKRLWKLLPEEAQRAEKMFSPQGVVDIDLIADRKGGRWQPSLTLKARGLSLAYEEMPYPLTDATGTVIYRPGELRTENFTAKAAGQTVRILVDLQFPPGERFGVIDIVSQGPVPIDERLLRALKPPQRQILRELDARGAFTVDCNAVLDSKKSPPMKLSMDLIVSGGSISYQKFAYPINQIQGRIAVRDQVWDLQGLTGQRDSAYIKCDGSFAPSSKGDHLLSLNFIATDVPFSDELRIALPPNIVELWDDMQPRGSIDHLKIDLKYPINNKKTPPDVRIVAQKWNDRQNVRGRSMSLEPMLLPIRLDQVVGKVTYHNGRIDFANVEARHGAARVAVTGEAFAGKKGGWQTTFSELFAERLQVTPELLSALPPRLRSPLENLQISGQFLVRGTLGFAFPVGSREVAAANWDLRIDTEDGSLNAGAPIEQIRGGMKVFGDLTGKKPICFGELNVDSLRCRNSHLSNIRGPLSIDAERVLLGSWSLPSRPGVTPVALSATFCSGRVTADCGAEFDKEGNFSWSARFDDVDLAELARDSAPSLKGTSGRASGQIGLKGSREGSFTWRGGGEVVARDAKMYELPVFLATLKNLGAKQLDKSAFQSAEVRFLIEGEDITFDHMRFVGEGIELLGTGIVSMDGDMDLQFGAEVGPEALRPPFFRPLMGAASRQLFVIEAKGSVQAPQVKRVVFPGVNELLNQMFPESKQAKGGPPSYAPARATTTGSKSQSPR
jgi:hypothetical protein